MGNANTMFCFVYCSQLYVGGHENQHFSMLQAEVTAFVCWESWLWIVMAAAEDRRMSLPQRECLFKRALNCWIVNCSALPHILTCNSVHFTITNLAGINMLTKSFSTQIFTACYMIACFKKGVMHGKAIKNRGKDGQRLTIWWKMGRILS